MKLNTIFLVLMAIAFPAVALAATAPTEVHATGVDLRPVLSELLLAAFTILSGGGVWVLRFVLLFLKSKTGVNVMEQEKFLREYLEAGMTRGLKFAQQELDDADWTKVEVKNQMLAMAATYVMTSVPDALSYFKLDEVGLRDRLAARLTDLTPAATTVVNVAAAPAAPAKAR